MSHSKFALNNCLLFTIDKTNLSESLNFIEENLKALTERGDQSKILFIRGSHGSKDGTDGLRSRKSLEDKLFTSTCAALGTTHDIDPWTGKPRWQLIQPKQPASDDIGSKLREKLHRVGAKVEILNMAEFHKDSQGLVRFVRSCQPTAIVVNWCYSQDGDVHKLLTKTGICSQLLLGDERVLLTGNIAIAMDDDQSDCLKKAARIISRLKPDSPPMRIFLWGPAGNADSFLKVD